MSTVTLYVGLDYHDESVQVCVMDDQGRVLTNRACDNDWLLISAAVSAAQPSATVKAALEACCGAANLADQLIVKAGWSVQLAHPGYVRRMKQNPDKTDHADAELLADLCRVGYLPRVWLAPAELRELRRLVRYRRQRVDERRNVMLRLRAILRELRIKNGAQANPWTKKWLSWLAGLPLSGDHTRWIRDRLLKQYEHLTSDLDLIDSRLSEVAADDRVILHLMGQRGVGLVTAAVWRAEIGQVDRFASGKQLARFCGLTPRNASSGTRQADAGLVKAGNRLLRDSLIEVAHCLIHWDERWTRYALHLKQQGKPYNVIVAAVANHWVRWLYHQLRAAQLAPQPT